jgi:hypothetical protein
MVNLIQQCNWNKYTVKNDGKSDENMTNFFNIFVLAWLSNVSGLKTLKLICQAPVRLIGKRGLICDHRNIGLNFRRMFVYF